MADASSKKARVAYLLVATLSGITPVRLLRPSKFKVPPIQHFHSVSGNNIILWFVNRKSVTFMMFSLR